MATIETVDNEQRDAFEECFILGQSDTSPWHHHPRITSDVEASFRSISVGDVFEVNDKFFAVEGVGFKEVSLK